MIAWSERDFEQRIDDLLAPLQRPVRRGARALGLELRRAGNRYTPRPAFSCTPSTGIAAIAAVADGYGSMTIIMSSIFIALTMSRPRVCEFGAWPQ